MDKVIWIQLTNNNTYGTIIASSKYTYYKYFTVVCFQVFLSNTNKL